MNKNSVFKTKSKIKLKTIQKISKVKKALENFSAQKVNPIYHRYFIIYFKLTIIHELIIHFFLITMGFLTQSLTIPTPIVFFISLIANRPNGGNSLNISRQIGLRGSRLTKQQSPFLTDLG